MPNVFPDLQDRIKELGLDLFKRSHAHHSTSVSELNPWTQEIIQWCLSNPDVKARVLRFVDVLPSLKSERALTEHIRDYFPASDSRLPFALKSGSFITNAPFTGRAVSKLTKHLASEVARQFICGENIAEAVQKRALFESHGYAASFDVLGEAVLSDQEADKYQNTYLDLIDQLPAHSHVSLKLSALSAHYDPLGGSETIREITQRLLPILVLAFERETTVCIDGEHYQNRDLMLGIIKTVLSDKKFKDYPFLGTVFQAYLRDSEASLRKFVDWLKENHQTMQIRLVKGAYWDSETAHAEANGWPVPVWQKKASSDANFERLTELLFSSSSVVKTAIGSHNVRSVAHALAAAEHWRIPSDRIEFQLLYGMADPLKKALLELNQKVRVYAPFGPLIPGMAYLVRRILENTSNESFLKMDSQHEKNEPEFLEAPRFAEEAKPTDVPPSRKISEFKNEPALDFSTATARETLKKSLKDVSRRFADQYPLIINGKKIETARVHPSRNPSRPDQIIGHVHKAEWQHAEEAVKSAVMAQPEWNQKPAAERAAVLFEAAHLMRGRRSELAAWEIFETGKTWREADGDITEAIDFLEYYGRAIIHLSENSGLLQVPGELNETRFHGRGVALIISPWNFPLAILTGMTAAALVTGNATIIKPAETSNIMASHFVQIMLEAGLPPGALSYLPGSGADIGRGLVRHPLVDLIAFTGSKEVGLSIIQEAKRTGLAQANVKKVIAEMGGKNAIIVDEDADLDEALHGVLASAFGYQGQKCSACSRLILMDSIYHPFMDRLTAALKGLRIGDPQNSDIDLGPVIDLESLKKIQQAVEMGKREARLVYQGTVPANLDGHFQPPVVFSDAPTDGILARQEIFGPVLTVFRAYDFEQALELANDSEFALTGGLYSRSPRHLEYAKRHFACGNLYLNRKITGAMVGRQPFGGFRMSGLGSKAGGIEYLSHFLTQTTVTENTFRHGFPF